VNGISPELVMVLVKMIQSLLPGGQHWDGLGKLDFKGGDSFKKATGLATEFFKMKINFSH